MNIEERLAYLGEAAVSIGTRLDPGESARALVAALVPTMAETVGVHMLEGLFTGNRLGEELREVVAGKFDQQKAVDEAMALGEPVQPEPSVLALPMRVRGRTLGVVLMHREEAYGPLEVLMAGQLAVQAALAADNAHRYRVEAAAADTLQRSMLPDRLPRFAGVDITHRYLPASDNAKVGGDWFDAIALPGSRVALIVGDVMGHGMRSAAIMGQLRTAVQTLAALDLPPDQVLRQLDNIAQRLGETYLATCLYVVYDPVARRCTFANAGHLPPVLVRAGEAVLLDVPEGVPIGVGGAAFEPVELPVADGDRLVLCTDGLVEVRGQDIMTGLGSVCRQLSARKLGLEAQCEDLLSIMPGGDRQDDVAVLMADLRGIPVSNVARWMLQPKPTTPGRIRRLIRATLKSWDLSDQSEITELLATELVTNAVRHANRVIDLRLLRTEALLVEVYDDDFTLPMLRDAAEDDEGGRGLQMVSRMSRRWGSTRTASGKVVWFELPLT